MATKIYFALLYRMRSVLWWDILHGKAHRVQSHVCICFEPPQPLWNAAHHIQAGTPVLLTMACCGEKIGCWIQTINSPNWWCKHSPHNFFLVPCWDCISKGQNWGFKLQGTFCHGKNLPLTQLLKNTLGSKSSLLQQLSEKGPSAAGRPKEGQPNKMHRSLLHEEGSAFIHQGSKKKRRNEEALCK